MSAALVAIGLLAIVGAASSLHLRRRCPTCHATYDDPRALRRHRRYAHTD